jgi:hypothetical protein
MQKVFTMSVSLELTVCSSSYLLKEIKKIYYSLYSKSALSEWGQHYICRTW